ncbi:SOS-response transcriptional repressor LexA/DNA-binding XRE family transcriptional regulator [Clostridium sardiniense]|nr:SOS-response transcriptional repressor LexA/DNA-binding XRE family transcriptional regulator [Clostridium sardiniense]
MKKFRLEKNLTQLELSKKLNISRQRLSNYELGNREPDLLTLLKLSNFFNCSIEELILDDFEIPNQINSNKFNINNYSKILFLEKFKNEKKELIKQQLDIPLEIKRLEKLLYEDIPNKIKEIDTLIKFLESNSQENNNFKNTKNDTEFSSELSIDLKNLSDEKTSKEKNIDDYSKKKKSVKIPVYDLPISAGVPKYSEEPIIDELRTLELKRPLTEDNLEEFYILKVSGDSMNNIVDDGEEILIQGTNCVENGEIAAVTLLNDSDSTIKYYYRHGNEIILKPNSSNPKHHTQKYNLDEEEILVQGRYIGKVKDYLIQSERD